MNIQINIQPMRRWFRAVLLLTMAALLTGIPCDSTSAAPDSQPAKGKRRSAYSGQIIDRARVITLPLDRAESPLSIVVAQGEHVHIFATVTEGGHTLSIGEYVTDFALKAGKNLFEFDANTPGEFPILCSCKASHGVLTVQGRDLVRQLLARYGLLALLIGLMLGIAGIPMPDELMLTFAGGLASTGNYNMDYLPTILTAFAGASIGISFSYVLGRTVGLGVVHKWGKYMHITPEKLNRVHEWYAHKKGRWALMFCIFMPVFRHITAIVAGTSRMPFWEFALFAYAGVLMWVSTFITLGFFFADYWTHMSNRVHTVLLVGSLLVGLGVLIWYILKNRREHMKHLRQQAENKT